MKESINLQTYLWQQVIVTYRDGKLGIGVIHPTTRYNYPFYFASETSSGERNHSYTETGKVLMFNESNEDIVSIKLLVDPEKKVKNNLHLLTYLDRRVRVTFRDGSKALGSIYRSDSGEDYPFVFMPEGDDPSETYTADGQVYVREEDKKDILAIEILDPVDGDEKDSAVEKMALALLPAVFTSLEEDPNLEEALEKAIRGTFLAMFGDDVTGETLNHSVSVIKSRISLSLKQC